jgi:hypothetical protein
MKATAIIALLALLAGSAVSFAGVNSPETTASKPSKPASSDKPANRVPKKDTTVTGSHIKRDVRRNGLVTDGPNPVYVLDSKAIRDSGAADLRQLLVRNGLNR